MTTPTSDQITTWAGTANRIAPWTQPGQAGSAYFLAETILDVGTTASDDTILDWANQLYALAGTFTPQQWAVADTTGKDMVITGGGNRAVIVVTGALIAAGIAPPNARGIALALINGVVSGATTWDPAVVYSQGLLVVGSNNELYASLVADNLDNDPTTDGGVNWSITGATPVAIADPAISLDKTSYNNDLTGNPLLTNVAPTASVLFAVAEAGDTQPRIVVCTDAGNGIFFGDGTIDPFSSGVQIWASIGAGLAVLFLASPSGASLEIGQQDSSIGSYSVFNGPLQIGGNPGTSDGVVLSSGTQTPNGNEGGNVGDLYYQRPSGSLTPKSWWTALWQCTTGGAPGTAVWKNQLTPNIASVPVTGSANATMNDVYSSIDVTDAAASTITVLTDSWAVGDWFEICQLGAGQVTIAPSSGLVLNFPGGRNKIAEQYGTVTLRCVAANTFVVAGDLTT